MIVETLVWERLHHRPSPYTLVLFLPSFAAVVAVTALTSFKKMLFDAG